MASRAWLALALLFIGGEAWASLAEIGRITQVQGKVFVGRAGALRAAQRGQALYEGETVRTGLASKALIFLGQDIRLMLKENTQVTPVRKGEDWALNMNGGTVLSKVRNPKKRPDHFQIRTKSAVLGVRGTTFFVQDLPSHPLYLCVCEGKLAVSSPDGKSTADVSGNHHDSPVVIQAGPGPIRARIKDARAGMMSWQHTDADIRELETSR